MLKAIVRTFSFGAKEIVEVRRQPRLILTLILGPFLILLLFGVGYNSSQPPLHTVLVIPPNSGLPTNARAYQDQVQPPFVLDAVLTDEAQARRMVQQHTADVALVLTSNPTETVRAGRQAQLLLYYNQIDPLQAGWIPYFGNVLVTSLNQRIQTIVITDLQQRTGDTSIPAQVLVSPLQLESRNFIGYTPSFVAFYAPGVLALLLQHLATSLTSLAIVRERLLGTIELFRVSPIGRTEIFFGKYVAYGLITLLVAALLTALMVYALGVPLLGQIGYFAATLVLLTAASLSLGLMVSALSRSESQAVQFSMILLLASILFSGFFLPLNTLLYFVRWLSYLLPVTYGIAALKDVMLLGQAPSWWTLGPLLAIFLIALVIAAAALGRDLARR